MDPSKISLPYGKFCVSRQHPSPAIVCKSLTAMMVPLADAKLLFSACPSWGDPLGLPRAAVEPAPPNATAMPPCSSPFTNPASCRLDIPAQENPGLFLESRGELMEMQHLSPTVWEQRAKPFPWERFHGPNCLVGKKFRK